MQAIREMNWILALAINLKDSNGVKGKKLKTCF